MIGELNRRCKEEAKIPSDKVQRVLTVSLKTLALYQFENAW